MNAWDNAVSRSGVRPGGMWAALVCALIVLLTAPAAWADAVADAAFDQGLKHMEAGRYDAACEAFGKSESAGPTMASRYQLGRCNEERGRFATAQRAYLDAADIAQREGDSTRANVARKRAAELERKIPLLLITKTAQQMVPGLILEHNGVRLATEAWSKPMKVDPGRQILRFAAPKYDAQTVTVEVNKAGQITSTPLPALVSNPNAKVPAPGPVSPKPAPKVIVTGRKPTALFWTGVGLTGLGALVAIGGAVELATCEFCDEFDEDNSAGVAALVLGGVMVAVGVPFMIFGWKDKTRVVSSGSIEAVVSPRSANLLVHF